jgi:hypothetical protein
MRRASSLLLFSKYYSSDQIKADDEARASGSRNLTQIDHLEDTGVVGSKISKWTLQISNGRAQDKASSRLL